MAASSRHQLPSLSDGSARRLDARRASSSALACLSLLATLTGCERDPPNKTPEGAVRELVERMAALHGADEDATVAYDLLSQATRNNLAERASRYGAASGKQIAPQAMLVPSRFLVRFEPHDMKAQIVGAHALVDVIGREPHQRARIPCVYEEGLWRVHLALPDLPPVKVRPDAQGLPASR